MINMKKSSVIIIGAGPAGLFAAHQILSRSQNLTVVLLEQGVEPQQRRCIKNCLNCNRQECNILCGVGGAGLYSDGKLVLNLDSGGKLNSISNLSENEKKRLIWHIEKVLRSYDGVSERSEELSQEEETKWKAYFNQSNLNLKHYDVTHMGTRNLINITKKFVNALCENERFELITNCKVVDVKKGEKKRNPAPPFTTSTMQQDASRKLNFALKKTMSVAQTLYEGVKLPDYGDTGLITYMRTDSTRISDEARAAAKEQIEKLYGESYYENRYYKTKSEAQDAHEAIRPSHIELTPDAIKDSLSADQYKLYKLIYNRFLASQMASAIYDTVSVSIDGNEYNFRANGQTLKFKGYMTLYVENEDKEEFEKIPELVVGEEVKKEDIEAKQSFTEPPARYTEASLVKTLEEKGIGRPSTYAPTITTILQRRYIEKVQKQLMPTELGRIVNRLLIDNFGDIINVEFTAQMEEEFDKIAEGNAKWKQVIADFYTPFGKIVEKVEKELEHVKLEYEESDVPCEKCGRMMVIKYGRFGKFLACPGFPECHNAKPIIETIDVPCPVCGAVVQVRKTKAKRNYYICEKNSGIGQGCYYISWNKPKIGEVFVPNNEEDMELFEKDTKKTAKKTVTKKKTTKKAAAKKTTKKSTTKKK